MTQDDNRKREAALFKRQKATDEIRAEIKGWEIWECAESEFSHDYDRKVSLFVHEGGAQLTFSDGSEVDLQAGDFLTTEAGASAVWTFIAPIRNSYCYH